jgi:hypothetical protein
MPNYKVELRIVYVDEIELIIIADDPAKALAKAIEEAKRRSVINDEGCYLFPDHPKSFEDPIITDHVHLEDS